ncbi:MAG: PHP domain-containing protein [Deltaproteobacteria bacterium]
MPRGMRTLLAVVSAVAAAAWLLSAARTESPPLAGARVLAADGAVKWFKGNIHTHTLWSDGNDYPEMVSLWYKERGYDFLSFSDHNTLLNRERWIDALKNKGGRVALEKLKARFPDGWVEERTNDKGEPEVRLKTFEEIASKIGDPARFLLIQGEEISDHFRRIPVHMNATNLGEVIPPMGGESVFEVMQRNTDALVAQRERTGRPMLIHLNHPNFHYGITAEELSLVRGENFFEVYNGHPDVHNEGDSEHASAERIWDIILTRRITMFHMPLMFGLATDDGHNYHGIPSRASEPGRGWIVVLARELTAGAIIAAMDQGSFYASSGVKLERIASTPGGIEVEVVQQEGVDYVIDFIGTRRGFDPESEPVFDVNSMPVRTTRRYSNDIGRVLETVTGPRACYAFDDDDLYVRARVTSTKKHPNPSSPGEYERAWCQPVLGPAARDR